MRSHIARSNGSLLLLVVMLTSAILPWVSPVRRVVQAALNCQTRQCVQVPYMANGPGDSRNIFCVRYRAEFEGVRNWGQAYSEQVAVEDCYGKDSVGGNHISLAEGHYWEVVCTPDCSDIPADSYCSGRVAQYLSPAKMDRFYTRCQLEEPPPPPPPEPDPDPDP